MFSPFFFQLTLCEPFAQFVLREGREPWLSWLSSAPATKAVAFDSSFTCESLRVSPVKMTPGRVAYRLQGEGRALGNVQIVQDKAYFEAVVLRKGEVCIGVAKANRDHLRAGIGVDEDSWGQCFSCGSETGFPVRESEVVGCVVDQSDFPAKISYTLQGKLVEGATISGMRGPLLPAVSLSSGAQVEVTFCGDLFVHEPPNGSSAIIFSQNFLF